ncbi:hypothetical protein BT96DRAFT_1005934 [Gymnopus androsaceus JB14]|uniref:SUN domain-containing protein n=1 Tax=Gymnopus androsaceus JB14 TaxID=1447944 RepID=A0A6A4GMT5_9AGAR|nr:hypothetical protein BT96DRAFT_1005934 [Gymnopus androsaceus JB14]
MCQRLVDICYIFETLTQLTLQCDESLIKRPRIGGFSDSSNLRPLQSNRLFQSPPSPTRPSLTTSGKGTRIRSHLRTLLLIIYTVFGAMAMVPVSVAVTVYLVGAHASLRAKISPKLTLKICATMMAICGLYDTLPVDAGIRCDSAFYHSTWNVSSHSAIDNTTLSLPTATPAPLPTFQTSMDTHVISTGIASPISAEAPIQICPFVHPDASLGQSSCDLQSKAAAEFAHPSATSLTPTTTVASATFSPDANGLTASLSVASLSVPTAAFLLPQWGKNYALDRTGGRIVDDLTSPTHTVTVSKGWLASWLGRTESNYPHSAPSLTVIEEDIHIGHCWRFQGPKGRIGIKLSENIRLSHFSVYFPDPRILSNHELKEAPKRMRLWASVVPQVADELPSLVSSSTLSEQNSQYTFFLAEDVTYDARLGGWQVFKLKANLDFWTSVVIIEVVENWGSDTTCLYSVTVHGVNEDVNATVLG